jgi:hypothetical protein
VGSDERSVQWFIPAPIGDDFVIYASRQLGL